MGIKYVVGEKIHVTVVGCYTWVLPGALRARTPAIDIHETIGTCENRNGRGPVVVVSVQAGGGRFAGRFSPETVTVVSVLFTVLHATYSVKDIGSKACVKCAGIVSYPECVPLFGYGSKRQLAHDAGFVSIFDHLLLFWVFPFLSPPRSLMISKHLLKLRSDMDVMANVRRS